MLNEKQIYLEEIHMNYIEGNLIAQGLKIGIALSKPLSVQAQRQATKVLMLPLLQLKWQIC